MSSRPVYFQPGKSESLTLSVDLCVYGGTSGGVIAAIEAASRGLSVVLLESGPCVGGMTAGGLGMTDVGNKHVIGGLARKFYQRVGARYGVFEEWRFEPHVAREVFEDWLGETNVRVFCRQFVAAVEMHDRRIVSLRTTRDLNVSAKMFIDASYEGDLLAMAGVSHMTGREDNKAYAETVNGQQIHREHQFLEPVDPYIVPGTPGSGLLPGIESGDDFEYGRGDARLQAFNFRMCLTRRDDIRQPFPKPVDYRPEWYLLLKRFLATGWDECFQKFDPIRNGKTDTNNHGAVSTDFIGMNHGFEAAGYEERERIYQAHVSWQQGLMWTLANDPEIPPSIREPMSLWGLCRDEFPESGGWPHALYIRECRRMISDCVMTEHHCRGVVEAQDPVGMAAYGMDSHNCRRFVRDGRVVNEGDVQAGGILPYPVSYGAIVPKQSECTNLLVPFCLSATHISFGSIRMEPVFMGLSQSAAIAAAIAIAEDTGVQNVPYTALHAELAGAGQILEQPEDAEAFVVGETEAEVVAS